MNVLIVGLPGNGKGVKAMQLLVDEMRLGKRPVITNLAVEKLPWIGVKNKVCRGLQQFLREEYDDDFNCNERIFRVSDTAVQNFYLYRALTRKQVEKIGAAHLVGYRQVLLTDGVLDRREFYLHQDYQLYVCDHEMKEDKSGRTHCQSFNAKLLELSGPHFGIADECWKFWPARGWASTSDADVYYNAQHRHFGDDNLFLTQRHNDIDSIIVDRCQESIVMTHHGKMSFGMFRQPNLFSEAIYNGRPMPSKEPMTRKVFRLDVKGLCECYDTSAGVGITGRGAADIGARKRGLPFWLVPVLGVLVVAAVAFGLVKGSHYVTGIFVSKKKTSAASEKQISASGSSGEKFVSAAASSGPDRAVSVATNEIWCTGSAVFLSGAVAFFSDGSTVDADSGLQMVSKTSVRVAGRVWPVRPALPVAGVGMPFDYDPESHEVPMPVGAPKPVNEASVTVIGAPRGLVHRPSGFNAGSQQALGPLASGY